MEKMLRQKLPECGFGPVDPRHRRIMQAVKGKGNRTTEARLRAALVQARLRGWTSNARTVRGQPDFFFRAESVAIFVDGCFWHGCPRCGHVPKKNSAFWEAKITRNTERDAQTTVELRTHGILVLRFWEHQLTDNLGACIERVKAALRGRGSPGDEA